MVRIKICGLTNLEDALAAAEAGADMLGFIFYPPSPRYVAPETVRAIVSDLRRQAGDGPRPRFVGVFVNETEETVRRILDECGLDAAQLHGDEPPEMVARFRGRAFKALRPRSPEEAGRLVQSYRPAVAVPPPCFLLDAYHPALYGGAGHVTDWSMAAAVARRWPVLLAGGLTPDNVAEAVRTVRPWGVDVSSGVEAEKGKKDHEKLKAFVERVKRKA